MNKQEIDEMKKELKLKEDLETLFITKESKPKKGKIWADEVEVSENYEIFSFQQKCKKILTMQKLQPEKIIKELTLDTLFGMEEEYLDLLIDYYNK